MILKNGELPSAAIGDRVMMLPEPPKQESEYGIVIPGVAQHRPSTGILLDAGLAALDKLYDNGIEIGDKCWWGQFAGVIYEWDHITEYGKFCDEHSWERRPSPRDRTSAHECSRCGCKRLIEPIILVNVDDIQTSEELAERRRAGKVRYKRGVGPEKQTVHYLEREGE
jgi:co-chaperonin GroES (HSP10)